MTPAADDLRPPGTVEVPCSGPGCYPCADGGRWYFWVQALDPRLPDGPFQCSSCEWMVQVQQATGSKVKRVLEPAPESCPIPGSFSVRYVLEDAGAVVPEFGIPDVLRKGD